MATVTTTTPSSSATDPGMLGDWYTQYIGSGPQPTTNWTVDQNQTVQGQVGNIVAADGVLMQQAATKGLQQSNQRGLLNTSLGVQASQNALYDAAMPMASQDAGTYADAAKTNAAAKNTQNMGMFNAATDLYNNREQRAFQQGENATDRTFNTSEREASQQFTAGENTLNRDFETANREDTQSFQAGEQALDRAFTTGERVGAQDFTSVQAALDREQEEKIRTLMEGGMDRRQATDIASSERMQKAGQVFDADQAALDRTQADKAREDSQAFTQGESALDRAFSTGERIGAQDFDAAQAVLDRDQQAKMQSLQESGMDKRQATDIASRERMQTAQQTFDSATLAKEQAFILQKDAADFEQDLAILDQQNGTALAGQYRNAMGQALNDYNARVAEIQASDMDADVKAEQVASLGTLFLQQQQFTNTLFESAPAWGDEWATVSSEFLNEEG